MDILFGHKGNWPKWFGYLVTVASGQLLLLNYSLVPRPSHGPVFDRLQYTFLQAITNWMVGRPGNEGSEII